MGGYTRNGVTEALGLRQHALELPNSLPVLDRRELYG